MCAVQQAHGVKIMTMQQLTAGWLASRLKRDNDQLEARIENVATFKIKYPL